MYMTNDSDTIEELLGLSLAAIDIPDDLYHQVVERYDAAAEWLSRYWPGGEIYPQGSIRLGTIIAPINPGDDYDIDLVCRLDLEKEAITKVDLKTQVGSALNSFVAFGPDGQPRCEEGKRCWTLEYPAEPFHMDVLPAIPDLDGGEHQILLTDRELHEWQHSNPKGYAEWFHGVMSREAMELREAAIAKMDVEEPPPSAVKTTLQRAVQALKRHRDRYFSGRDNAPASIILTTLAARAYRGGGSLYEVLTDITGRMAAGIDHRDGVLWVPNPVLEHENFADRWRDRPERSEAFFQWIEQAQSDFSDFGRKGGLDRVAASLQESLGEEPVKQAFERLGTSVREQRQAGRLAVGATGLLGPASTRSVPDHTFHGDATIRPPRA